MRCELLLAAVMAAAAAACDPTLCNRQSDCASGAVCTPAGVCLSTATDAAVDGDAPDASDGDAADAPVDAPTDADLDAIDAPIDAPTDAPTDAAIDAAIDAPVDAPIDANPRSGIPTEPIPGDLAP